MKATKVTSKKALNERKTMGLAASQARLLTITARKSDCEFQSMRLSHEKIALARSMEKISDEYQAALGQTKLVYDYYGSGTSAMPLNYNLLTTPSVYNDYYSKLITDKTNRVVLDSKLAAAAQAAGIPTEGLAGTPSDAIRNTFIQALCEGNVISNETAASIQNVTYGNTIGLGSTFNITTSYESMDYNEFIARLDARAVGMNTYGIKLGGENKEGSADNIYADVMSAVNNSDKVDYDDISRHRERLYFWDEYKHDNAKGARKENPNQPDITLSTLLNGDTDYVIEYQGRHNYGIDALAQLQDKCVSMLEWMMDSFAAVLGDDETNTRAIQYAYDTMYNILYPSNFAQDYTTFLKNYMIDHQKISGDGRAEPDWGDFKGQLDTMKSECDYKDTEYAPEYLGYVFQEGTYGWVAVDLNNIAKAFLTAYLEGLNDDTSYSIQKGTMTQNVLFGDNSSDIKNFEVWTSSSNVDTGDENIAASFYDAMLNMICSNGWVKNEQITDAEYMQEMFKNGTIFISSIGNDGFYYQGNYNTDRFISEVPDEEAIAQAEAKYNSEKSKIQSKEDTLDVKMKNLDTEISSLTTEYDTTKSIIQKAIEKSFKRYEA